MLVNIESYWLLVASMGAWLVPVQLRSSLHSSRLGTLGFVLSLGLFLLVLWVASTISTFALLLILHVGVVSILALFLRCLSAASSTLFLVPISLTLVVLVLTVGRLLTGKWRLGHGITLIVHLNFLVSV
jgi:hypothetical protein